MAIEEAGVLYSTVSYRTFRRGAANENKDVELTLFKLMVTDIVELVVFFFWPGYRC